MTLREEVLMTVGALPENKLETLLQFARFLKESKYTAGMQDKAEKDDAEINEVLANKPVRHGRWVKKSGCPMISMIRWTLYQKMKCRYLRLCVLKRKKLMR